MERANAAKVSMIKLIHRRPTAVIGDSAKKQQPTKTVKMTEILTVI